MDETIDIIRRSCWTSIEWLRPSAGPPDQSDQGPI